MKVTLLWIAGGIVVFCVGVITWQLGSIVREIRRMRRSRNPYWEDTDTLNGIPKEMREKMEREKQKQAPKGCLCVGGAEGRHDRECPIGQLDDRTPEL